MNKYKKPDKIKSTKAQDEMVGFALILIIVAIVFIVFISVYMRKTTEREEDYQANSFVQAALQYTTTCQEASMENLTIQRLIFKCQDKEPCAYREMDPCKILNDTLKEMIKESWNVGPNNPTKGYKLIINVSDDGGRTEKRFLNITEGVVTKNLRGAEQDFGKGSEYIVILFDVYSE
jgi:hypothetical protein